MMGELVSIDICHCHSLVLLCEGDTRVLIKNCPTRACFIMSLRSRSWHRPEERPHQKSGYESTVVTLLQEIISPKALPESLNLGPIQRICVSNADRRHLGDNELGRPQRLSCYLLPEIPLPAKGILQ